MGRYRIEYTTEERRYAIVEADSYESAVRALENGQVLEDRGMHGWDDWEIEEVYFEPEILCAREGCVSRTGPWPSRCPTPDEYCSLWCAVEAGAVAVDRNGRRAEEE